MQGVNVFSNNTFTSSATCIAGKLTHGYNPTNLTSGMQLCNQDLTPTSFNGGTSAPLQLAATQLYLHLLLARQSIPLH